MIENPHHDGSELYVSDPAPELGDVVDVFVRVPRNYPVEAVHVRSTPDADPVFAAARIDRSTEHETWWRASVRVANPDSNYRFLLDRGSRGYSWLTANGVHQHDVPDDRDFRLTTYAAAPSWAAESVMYQIFPDRFASSGQQRQLPPWAVPADWYDDPVIGKGPSVERQFYGGDLAGIGAQLDHIESLGVNTVYLTPFFPAASNHRYNASDFGQVDPLLGGDQALVTLTEQLHDRGIRVIGDLTTNHTGSEHPWFRAALRYPYSSEAEFYYWREEDPGYECWYGVPTLPKLNWASDELRRRMIDGRDAVVARWLRPPYNLDGWRIDVANMTGRIGAVDRNRDVARAIRAAMVAARPDALLLAEHAHDFSRDVDGDSWHGSMNYSGFTRPLWRWLSDPAASVELFGLPAALLHRASGADVVASISEFLAAIPWRVRLANMNMLGSHDTPRIRTITGDARLVEVAAVLLFTQPGIPTVYAGDEIGIEGTNAEGGRRPFPWKQPQRWDAPTLQAFRSLGRLRRTTVALQRGGLRWVHVGDDAIAYLRETADERVLVVASRAAGSPLVLPLDVLGPDGVVETLYGEDAQVDAHGIRVPVGVGAHVWRLTRS